MLKSAGTDQLNTGSLLVVDTCKYLYYSVINALFKDKHMKLQHIFKIKFLTYLLYLLKVFKCQHSSIAFESC